MAGDWHSMADIYTELGLDRPTKGDHMRLAAAIVKYNGKIKSRQTNGATYHFVPSLRGRISALIKRAYELGYMCCSVRPIKTNVPNNSSGTSIHFPTTFPKSFNNGWLRSTLFFF